MAEHQTIHYELARSVDLRQLVNDLPEVEASTVVVAFDESLGWTATDLELSRLVAAARNAGKRLIAEHGANATANRAVLLGFNDSAVVSDEPAAPIQQQDTRSITTSDQPTRAIWTGSGNEDDTSVIQPADRFSSTANLATYRPAENTVAGSWSAERSESAADETKAAPLVTPVSRSSTVVSKQVATTSGSQRSRASVAAIGRALNSTEIGRASAEAPKEEPAVVEPTPTRTNGRRRNAKIAAAVIAPLVVIGVVAALAVYMLPNATVTLVPREDSVSSTLTYGVATANSSFDIELDPAPLSSTSTAETTREATGERFEPVGTATGTVQITNPLTHEVTIPAGTELPAANGVTYYTADDVRLSAADPYGSMTFGSGTVGVYAGIIGPDGNIEAGSLTGQLGNEMFYTNPEAIGGGRMERYSVITGDDITAAREEVANQLVSIAREEFESQVPEGHEIVPGTLEISDPEIQVDPSESQDGQEVTANGEITVRAEIYDPDELHEVASSEADRQLVRHGGSERILLAETVDLKEPTELDGDIPGFEINVQAVARTVISEGERQQLIDQLVGLSREEAEALLDEHPKVDRYQIEIEPDWLPDRLPEFANNISIQVSSSEPTASR